MIILQKIQKQALRYVFNDFSSNYEMLRKKADRPLMYVQRLRLMVHEIFKCINKIGPKYLHHMISFKSNTINARRANQVVINRFNIQKCGFN